MEFGVRVIAVEVTLDNGEESWRTVQDRFEIVAESDAGNRLVFPERFLTAEEAKASIERAKATKVGEWIEADPVYGSPAYQHLDSLGYFYDREVAEDRGWSNEEWLNG